MRFDIYKEEIVFEVIKTGNYFCPTQHAFVVVESGEIELEVNECLYKCKKGHLLLVFPNIMHRIINLTEDLKLYIIVLSKEELALKVNFEFSRYEVYRTLKAKNGGSDELDEQTFANVIKLCELLYHYANTSTSLFTSNIMMGVITSLIYIIVGTVLSITNSERGEQSIGRKEAITMNFLELINKHASQQRDLSFYSQKLSISTKYLSNAVRDTTQQPPSQLIVEALLNNAKILILDSTLSIKEISIRLNFSDQYAFGKFFKKHTGQSPLNFRRHSKFFGTI